MMSETDRQQMQVDIACVGFGPATAGFLYTINQQLLNPDGTPKLESRVMPGMPLQIVCYERSDDLGFGVSGVVSHAESMRASLAGVQSSDIPMLTAVKHEHLYYLLDPVGASRRSSGVRFLDTMVQLCRWTPWFRDRAFRMPFIPGFLAKHGGWIFSIGQFSQWLAGQIMSTGLIQLWPGTPVSEPLFDSDRVRGIRLLDQGTDLNGAPTEGFMAGMDILADLTVVGDGPVGTVGMQLDDHFGLPPGHERKDWALGIKAVVELAEDTQLQEGSVFHTFGFPEPEIFGFIYIHPNRLASLGIFVPSWLDNPVRTGYRYLQHWMRHPLLAKLLKGSALRSWGAKSLQESGRLGEPFWVGDGFVRIGEGSGSTNIFTNSGVDEAWHTGKLLADAIVELYGCGKEINKQNLQETYVKHRRSDRLEKEAKIAAHSRDGFQKGLLWGLLGMMLTHLTRGKLSLPIARQSTQERLPNFERFYKKKITASQWDTLQQQADQKGIAMNELVMAQAGWPEIPFDGRLMMSHQDAMLIGGKVQAPGGYRDHVSFLNPQICRSCRFKLCIEMCSGEAITPGPQGVPLFDRDKCIHCGACTWNCTQWLDVAKQKTNIGFSAGTGGLHSSEN